MAAYSSSSYSASSSSSSSSPSSSHSTACSLSRFRHHLITPHTHRATKAADLACLLDPSYRPGSASQEYAARQVYVDHAGETHDPDYRLFNYPSPKRSQREIQWSDDDEDEDEQVAWYEEQQQRQERTRRASFEEQWSALYRPGSRASDPTYNHYYTAAASSSSPSSISSPITFARGYLSDEEDIPSSPLRHKKLRRRRASLDLPVEDDDHDFTAASDSAEVDALAFDTQRGLSLAVNTSLSVSLSTPPSPTASAHYAFRRSWHALALRTQVAAYRAKKRMQGLVFRAHTL